MEHYTIRLYVRNPLMIEVNGFRFITTNPKAFQLAPSPGLKVKTSVRGRIGIDADRAGLDLWALCLGSVW